jgi:hypothetical protein
VCAAAGPRSLSTLHGWSVAEPDVLARLTRTLTLDWSHDYRGYIMNFIINSYLIFLISAQSSDSWEIFFELGFCLVCKIYILATFLDN